MQATQPQTIKANIVEATNKYLTKLGQAETVVLIQEHTEQLMNRLKDLLNLNNSIQRYESKPQV